MRDAYVTMLMKNDGYLPGALTLGYALRRQSDKELICLATPAVSAAALGCLKEIYDRVPAVEEIHTAALRGPGVARRQDRDRLLTRFQALRLGADGGPGAPSDRIVLLDADILPLRGYDALFDLPAPAGIPMRYKSDCLRYTPDGALDRRTDAQGRWRWHEIYEPLCPHSAAIPASLTDGVLADPLGNMGVNAGLWRLDPSSEEYDAVLRALRDPALYTLVTERFPWPEMQLATALWSGRWHCVDVRYAAIGGYPDLSVLCGVHYAGLKPWQLGSRSLPHYARHPDFRLWYEHFCALYWSCPPARRVPALRRLHNFAAARLYEA